MASCYMLFDLKIRGRYSSDRSSSEQFCTMYIYRYHSTEATFLKCQTFNLNRFDCSERSHLKLTRSHSEIPKISPPGVQERFIYWIVFLLCVIAAKEITAEALFQT